MLLGFGTDATRTSVRSQTLDFFLGEIPSQFNMLADGDDFTAASGTHTTWGAVGWERNAVGDVTSGHLAPDGTTTAEKLVENSATDVHVLIGPNSVGKSMADVNGVSGEGGLADVPLRVCVIAKAVERTRIVISIADFNASIIASAGYDLAGGNTGYDEVASAGWTIDEMTIGESFDGWRLCTFDVTCTGGNPGAMSVRIALDNGSGTAARSVSYAGNGTSGALLWHAMLLPRCMWDLEQTFIDDFGTLDTIDLNDTRVPGFNWYVHNRWPNFAASADPPITDTVLTTADPSTPDMFSISSPSVLRISEDGTFNPLIGGASITMSSAASLADPSQAVGTFHLNDSLMEIRAAWDPDIPNNHINVEPEIYGGSGVAFWTVGKDVWYDPDATVGIESDIMEAASKVGTVWVSAIHSFTLDPNVTTSTSHRGGEQPAGITDFHRSAALTLTTDTLITKGMRLTFYDGVMTSDGIVTWGITGPHAGHNTQEMMIHVGGGTGTIFGEGAVTWPLYVDWIRILKFQ